MPLVRCEVRNEYGLGQGELYSVANREDPKAVLDGVAVAGLVGILRQLGDLAEFAAEVFHGLQEQAVTTASRSHKLMVRVQNIEAAMPPLEKVVLAQTSHIHFAYTAGSEWHPRIQNQQNHFIYNDLPRFIMDSYEECRDPPRLHLLDKFDTYGPGSCLKRYSDPTFFRKVSGDLKEPNAGKGQKAMKTCKSKKKRSSQRNGDLPHSASMPNTSSRSHFTPAVNARTSPSLTASTIDITLKPDLGDHPNSFDSRPGSGYIECVFHLNSTVQPDEQESREFSSRFMQHNDIPDSGFPDSQHGVADDNFPCNSSPELIAPSSSCVTWDEKVEIVDPKGQHNDNDEALEMIPTVSTLDTQDRKVANLRNLDPLDAVYDDTNGPKSSTSRNQLEEVESEPDNYMDALNTIESESEIDIDCQTKCEVEQFSPSINNEVLENGMLEVNTDTSDHQPSKYDSHATFNILDHPSSSESYTASMISDHASKSESHTASSFSGPHPSKYESHTESVISDHHPSICKSHTDSVMASNGVTSCDLPISVPLKNFSDEQTSGLDDSKAEFIASDPLSSGSGIPNLQEPLSENTLSSLYSSQVAKVEFHGAPPTSFWTNGGLLGLQPSKPPDFTVTNAGIHEYVTGNKDKGVGPPNHTFIPNNRGENGTPGKLVKDAESMERVPSSNCSTSWLDCQDSKAEKSADSHKSRSGSNLSSAGTPGNELPPDTDIKAASTEASQETDENSSQMFGFGHRLLVNGFCRKMSLVSDGRPEVASSMKSGTAYQASPEKAFYEPFEHKPSVGSLTSSPPLQHMKISFQPINGFEAAKLKLRFPDGSQCNESVGDMFASFQLVPEPATPLHDVGSDSDNDSFGRSCHYMSDDCLSHHSETDSEQWDSGESPERQDHELSDVLCRVSSVESVSNSLQPGETDNYGVHIVTQLRNEYTENGTDPLISASLLDLPSFDALNPVLQAEANDNLDSNSLELQCPRKSTPLPPPFPPVQWQARKPQSDTLKDKHHSLSDTPERSCDLKLLGSTPYEELKSASATEAIAFKPESKELQDQQINWQKEVNEPANGKIMDEKGDFLEQIRTKSFNLKHASTAKSTYTSSPIANDKVTAILEKANAIRQAVGSDDGEADDSWSDS